eukprot:GHVH01012095.1.p1 GENE.GHVH01012095.1~~GHVH01012095.1.p1  ORF type:complete len:397 (+),score=29.18 GHVH01012095.1:183-1373(+)
MEISPDKVPTSPLSSPLNLSSVEAFSNGVSFLVAFSCFAFFVFTIFLVWYSRPRFPIAQNVERWIVLLSGGSEDVPRRGYGSGNRFNWISGQVHGGAERVTSQVDYRFRDEAHLSYQPILSIKESRSLRGSLWRRKMMNLMIISSALRTLSLFLVWFDERSFGTTDATKSIRHNFPYWLREVMFNYPSLIFATCFAVVVRFWIVIERTHQPNMTYYLGVLYRLVVVSLHVLFFMLLILCMYDRSFSTFHVVTVSSLALIFLVLGVFSVYYGLRMVSRFAPEPEDVDDGKNEVALAVVHRILFLSLTCPILWITRSVLDMILLYSAVWNLKDVFTTEREVVFRCFIYWGTELLPSIVILFVFWPTQPQSLQSLPMYGVHSNSLNMKPDRLKEPLIAS